MLSSILGLPGAGMSYTTHEVCDAEYRAALKASSPADPRKVVPRLPAPVRPGQRVNSIQWMKPIPNETQWAAIGAFLADRVVNP